MHHIPKPHSCVYLPIRTLYTSLPAQTLTYKIFLSEKYFYFFSQTLGLLSKQVKQVKCQQTQRYVLRGFRDDFSQLCPGDS